MAQLNANLILQGQQPQIESPVNNLAKMMQIQGMQQQNQLGQLKMDEHRVAGERRNKLASLLQGQYETPEARESALLQGGFMDEATKLGTDRRANQKSDLEMDTSRQKLATDRYTTYKKALGALSQRPDLSKDMAVQVGQELVSAGILPAEMFQKSIASMPDDPNALRARLREGVAAQLTPEQMFTVFAPKAEKIDNGQQIGFRDMNPNSPTYGQNTGGAPVQRQMTPGEVSSAATARRGQDITLRGQNMTDARGRESNEISRMKAGAAGPDGRPTKPMPATALKMQNEALDVIGIASSIQADLGTIEKQLETGKLDFGPVKNLASNIKNLSGMSDEKSRNFSTFKSSMEKLRNDSLRLNKGVQTDGDAQRAWNELFQNINDAGLVKQRLAEIKAINSRAVDLRKREVEDIRNNYNQPQYDFSGQTNVPSAITPPSGGANIDALLEKYK